MNLQPDSPATTPPGAVHLADPPAGAIQRMAAEMLDVLAEHLDEEPADIGLTELLCRSAEGAADAHGLAPNPWIRDGIETVALLGLAITALPLRVSLLKRDKLAERFAEMNANQQRTWVIKAADVLHRSNAIDSYGPPIGAYLAREAPQAEHRAVTRQLAVEPPPSRVDHTHEQGLYIQLLPDCLAPTDADRAAQLSFALPHGGDPVVIARGHAIWLTAYGTAAEVAEATTQLWGAPVIGEGCGAARWDPDSVTPLDPSYVGLLDREAEAIQSAWTLLIDLAHRFPAGGRSR